MADLTQDQIYKRGLLTGKLNERHELRVLIDAIWKDIATHVPFYDCDLEYVDNINMTRLGFLINDLKKKKTQLDRLNKDIETLKNDLGERNGG